MTVDLSYPIGRFEPNAQWTAGSRAEAIGVIAGLPATLRRAVSGLDEARLDTPYRPGGWTVRQVVHHLADSHIAGFIRMKRVLTLENPAIQPDDQEAWATLPDNALPIEPSLAIVDGVAQRWTALCRTLGDRELARVYTHAERGPMTLETHLHFFAWHARHHTAQITALRDRQGW
jgi:uncharacterized damage-inducible protein DinB